MDHSYNTTEFSGVHCIPETPILYLTESAPYSVSYPPLKTRRQLQCVQTTVAHLKANKMKGTFKRQLNFRIGSVNRHTFGTLNQQQNCDPIFQSSNVSTYYSLGQFCITIDKMFCKCQSGRKVFRMMGEELFLNFFYNQHPPQ